MATDWEGTFRAWSKPSSDTEAAKAANAERMIKDAIAAHAALAGCNIKVFAKGSYQNNTNVRLDSDVDISVCTTDLVFGDFSQAEGFTRADVGFGPAPYTYTDFKNEVEIALVAKFGRRGVTRGKKAFDIHPNSYRVDADVVACFEHRLYLSRRRDGSFHYLAGTQFVADTGDVVVNWPQQQFDNGVSKNIATGKRYKWITRVLKRLRNYMHKQGVKAAGPIPSYLIECLAWNAPDDCYNLDSYTADVRAVLASTFNATIKSGTCSEWGEVNELKYLFSGSQPWTREQAHAFLGAAWDYIGFE
jgi:hypothetical protein